MTSLRTKKGLIALDGLDGTGKSTALKAVKKWCEDAILKGKIDYKNLNAFEGQAFTEFAVDLKALMMKHKQNLSHDVLFNLYRAIWTDTWEKYGPDIESGNMLMITDRWLLTTAVYQTGTKSTSWQLIQSTGALPGITFLLTASKEVAMNRILQTRQLDDYEKEYFEKHDELQERFIKLSDNYSGQTVIINTDNLSIDEVGKVIGEHLDKYFGI